MPCKSQKKQTRLAFAAAPPASTKDAGGGETEINDRLARLSYGHPSRSTILPKKPSEGKKPPQKKSSKKSSNSKHRNQSPERAPEPSMDEKKPVQLSQDTSSDDEIVTPSSQRRKRRNMPGPDVTSADGEISDAPKSRKSEESSNTSAKSATEDSGLEETPRPRRKLKRKAESSPVITLDSDDSDDPIVSSPVKRQRLVVDTESPKTPRSHAHRDQLDIEEDLKDLQDSVVKNSRTRGRVAESARDRRFKHLETLRRRRAGLKEESEEESESGSGQVGTQSSPSRPNPAAEDSNSDSDAESAVSSNEDLDKYDDDFVLEDENEELGVPTEEIPFEFTRHAYKQPKEYFRDVVGWMVHNRLDPAFPRSDAMYEMAFMKLEDEVKGRAGSQLISSVWNPDFRNALLARPHMEITAFPTTLCHSCDACRRSGHPASSDMKLHGKAYSLRTLEPLNDDSDEDRSEQVSDSEENDGDAVEKDREGHVLPDQNQRFYLGRHCKDKAQLAHTLTHWRFHLNEWVVDYLERMGHMRDAEVLRRSNLSQKRKTRNAIDVINMMVEAGEIDKLWRDFHISLKSAREVT
ncbi:hypothetical protein N7492_006917, partial [Penicillium capsulatum]